MVLPGSHEVSRASRYSGTGLAASGFGYGAVTRSGATFQTLLLPTRRSITPALQPQNVVTPWFGLIPLRSPLLRESLLISSPAGTEMFHFPAFASTALCIQAGMTGHDSRRVAPFRNPRLKGCLAPPRGLSQPTASFIAFQCPGIHLLPLIITFSYVFPFLPSSIVNEQLHTERRTQPGKLPRRSRQLCGQGPRKKAVVEVEGIEPTASSLQSWRSPV